MMILNLVILAALGAPMLMIIRAPEEDPSKFFLVYSKKKTDRKAEAVKAAKAVKSGATFKKAAKKIRTKVIFKFFL
ncbi:hypothetical protein CRYUN_Cryun22dG0039600 [Craigia yunnanensis]